MGVLEDGITPTGLDFAQGVMNVGEPVAFPILPALKKWPPYFQGVVEIKAVCAELDVVLIGQIPFDMTVTEALVLGKPVTVYEPGAPASKVISQIWQEVVLQMNTMEWEL